jgi:hypothetical protein
LGLALKGTDPIERKEIMTRNLKLLGLALVAFLAMSAMVASAASAQGKLTSDGSVTLKATATGGAGANTLEAFGLKVECPGGTYTGHKYTLESETTHEETTGLKEHNLLIPVPATTVTFTPHYNQANHNCIIVGTSLRYTIDVNGCDYVFHLGGTNASGNYNVSADIVCPPNKEITITIWTTTDLHTSQPNSPFCVFHVPPQNGLTGAEGKNTAGGHIGVTGTISGITMRRTASASHPALCPHTTTTAGKLKLDLTVTGHNAVGANTSISLSD